jgi:uncharacterized membrane protein YeaQ/YmgE (transglycosylase-associated protein family)
MGVVVSIVHGLVGGAIAEALHRGGESGEPPTLIAGVTGRSPRAAWCSR